MVKALHTTSKHALSNLVLYFYIYLALKSIRNKIILYTYKLEWKINFLNVLFIDVLQNVLSSQ